LEINDGSTIKNLQVVCKREETAGYEEAIKAARTGSAVLISGVIKFNEKMGKPEIAASEIKLLKQASEDYPLQKKEHSMEFLREIAHLRGRTTTMSAIMKVRSKLAFAIHKFFQENDFT
jgi:asparaginyl-tRNA synthetase